MKNRAPVLGAALLAATAACATAPHYREKGEIIAEIYRTYSSCVGATAQFSREERKDNDFIWLPINHNRHENPKLDFFVQIVNGVGDRIYKRGEEKMNTACNTDGDCTTCIVTAIKKKTTETAQPYATDPGTPGKAPVPTVDGRSAEGE